jgi:spermidine synthase
VLIALGFANGCAALIYLAVWFQLSELRLGSSSTTDALLIATSLAGMCLGCGLFARASSSKRNPVRVFGRLHLGIAFAGLVALYGMTATAGSLAVLWLLPGVVMLGAAFAAMASVDTGFFSANLAGAAAGSLAASFYLLPSYDAPTAALVAAVLNLLVASAAFMLPAAGRALIERPYSRTAQTVGAVYDRRAFFVQSPAAAPDEKKITFHLTPTWRLYVTLALAAMASAGAQVIWSRQLSLLFGATVYSFSISITVFFIGLAIGSTAGIVLMRVSGKSVLVLPTCHFLICGAIAWAAFALAKSLPYWAVNPSITRNAWVNFQFDIFRAMWVMLPAACLWGVMFSIGVAATRHLGPAAHAVTLAGAIAGLAFFWSGSQHAQQVLILISAAAAVVVVPVWSRQARAAVIVGGGCAVLLAWSVPAVPGDFIAFGRFVPQRARSATVVYAAEGRNATVAVTRDTGSSLTLQRGGETHDIHVERIVGEVTASTPPDPESFLVLGLGAGVAAGAVAMSPGTRRIVIIENEPLVREVAAQYFAKENHDVVHNPKVEIRIEDGRRYLSRTPEKFDGIILDPPPPWRRGAAALYTQEFFALMKVRLNPGGVAAIVVPLYENSEEGIKSAFATFFEVFPAGAVYIDTSGRLGYRAVLFSTKVRDYAGVRPDFTPWLQGAVINRDRDLRLQYLAARGMNLFVSEMIYRHMRQ